MDFSTAERIDLLEGQTQALLGHLKAMEYGLRLLIATHPNPEVLGATLAKIEQLASAENREDDAVYAAAISQGLTALREQVGAVLLARNQPDDFAPKTMGEL